MNEKTLIPQQIEPIIGVLINTIWLNRPPLAKQEQEALATAYDLLDHTVDPESDWLAIAQLAYNLAVEYDLPRVAEALEPLLPDDPLSPAIEEGSS